MLPAAFRFAALVFLGPAGTDAADVGTRSAPTRPAGSVGTAGAVQPRLAVTRIGGVEFLDLDDAMARLGLNSKKSEAGRKFTFTGGKNQLIFETESRETFINGLRVFLGQRIAAQRGNLFISKIDFERGISPLLRPELIAPRLERPKIIVLDPGHGGNDDGMVNSRFGMQEKVYTLEVAKRVEKLLEKAGYKVVLTRSDDRHLAPDRPTDWKRRSEIANLARADLMVSIHFNSLAPDTKTNGSEIYTFTRQFQRSDRSAAIGQADDTETEPAPVNRFDGWSMLLAQSLHRSVTDSLKTPDRGHKTMHSAVLRGLNCPGVLVESAFLSSDTDAKLVATPTYQQQIAQAIADGIEAYSSQLEALRPKTGTATNQTTPSASNSR